MDMQAFVQEFFYFRPSLRVANKTPSSCKTMGRWSSDCWRLYVRACFEQTVAWTRRAGSQEVHDLQGTLVGAEVDWDADDAD